jgi:hypothetical protein
MARLTRVDGEKNGMPCWRQITAFFTSDLYLKKAE